MKKERIDTLLVNRGYFTSREQAKRHIMAGLVLVNQRVILKPGETVDVESEIIVKGREIPYVSRGGLKLEHALKTFQIDLNGEIMVDIGSSTGGFTDCALQNGAQLVYCIDVGYNQLDWKIRSDERVVVMERTNFRYATPDWFTKGIPKFASIDVSFISLRLILPPLYEILNEGGKVVALIKPQFEAGREAVGKNGIVRDPKVHKEVIESVLDFAYQLGFSVLGLTHSPIKGGEGNIEFLVYLEKAQHKTFNPEINPDIIISRAQEL